MCSLDIIRHGLFRYVHAGIILEGLKENTQLRYVK